MIINFLGDSITEGVGASSKDKMYVELVKKKLNCSVNNYGISGTRIARQMSKSDDPRFDLDFQMRAPQMAKSDFLFVFGGTNDFGHGDALIGDINSDDPYTFCGGLNNLIKIILKNYSLKNVCFILPMHRENEESIIGDNKKIPTLPLKGYVDIMKKILDVNCVKYIDLFYNGPLFDEKVNDRTYFFDSCHPNDYGHEYLSNVIISYLKKERII